MRRHYQEHAEEIKAYQKGYYKEHGEKVRARSHRYFQEHIVESRPKRMAYQREYRRKNPNYNRGKCHEYYVRHRAKEIRRNTELTKRNRERLYEFKATLSCSRCGQLFPDCPAVIDFHHKGGDPKLSKITLLIGGSGLASKRVQAELAKCIPLCANCHRIVHDLEKLKKERRTQ
jgi:hypothetical protein